MMSHFRHVKFKVSHKVTAQFLDEYLRPDNAYNEFIALRHVVGQFILRHPDYFYDAPNALAQNILNPTAVNKPHLNTSHPIILMGDFNADCAYIPPAKQQKLRYASIVVHTNVSFLKFPEIYIILISLG